MGGAHTLKFKKFKGPREARYICKFIIQKNMNVMTTNTCKIKVLQRCIQLSSTVLSTVITLGKCVHRRPSGVRERHSCIGLI
jgi:hypothetical protein